MACKCKDGDGSPKKAVPKTFETFQDAVTRLRAAGCCCPLRLDPKTNTAIPVRTRLTCAVHPR